VDGEFCWAGRAALVDELALRAAALAACHFTPGDDHVLMELGIDSGLWARYSSPPSWPPTYRRWSARAD
jgi:hypothetical protein